MIFNIFMSNLHKTDKFKRSQSPVAMVTKMFVNFFQFWWKWVFLFSFLTLIKKMKKKMMKFKYLTFKNRFKLVISQKLSNFNENKYTCLVFGENQIQSLCLRVCLCFQWSLSDNRSPLLVDWSSSNLLERHPHLNPLKNS